MNFTKKHNRLSVGQLILCILLGLFALICFLPLVLIVIVSFSAEASIAEKGFSFFPSEWSLEAYKYVGSFGGQIVQSYLVTIYETVVGTLLTLLLTSMFAYVLSRKAFRLRGFLSIFLLITMLFNGGMLSSFIINSNVYHLRNNLLILVLPGAVSAFNCIVMRTFIQSNVPDSLVEAAKIDGANEIYLFFKIVLPIMVPAMAAIGFMTAVAHWNEWQTAFLYIDNPDFATLQLMLIRIEKNLSFLQERMEFLSAEELQMLNNAPTESARMAILLCTLGPIMVAYPFFQKHFVKGITIGSVKG